MSKATVVFTDYPEPELAWETEQLAQRDIGLEAHELRHAPREDLIEAVRDADIVASAHAEIDAEVINSLRRCRMIIRHGVGYDNVDIAAATARGIRVATYPGYCTNEVAEHALALMLACARQLVVARQILQSSVEKGEKDPAAFRPMHSLRDQTLGIIGCGRIGSRVYELTASLGLRRIICDPYLPEQRLVELGIDQRFALRDLLPQSDFVTLHTPLNDETRHILSARELRLMKPTAYLINTARGGLVSTGALIKALQEERLAGAGLDVLETEPPPADCELLHMSNVVLSPHSAWRSEEAAWDIRQKILQDIYHCLNNEPPAFTTNEEVEQVLGGRAYRNVE